MNAWWHLVGLEHSWQQLVEWNTPWAALAWILAPLWWLWRPHRHIESALRIPFFELAVTGTGERPRLGGIVRPHGIAGGLILIIAWTAAVLAAMQPQWIEPPLTHTKATRDWLLAIDLSPSMTTKDFRNAQDHPVDRLTVVREVLNEFLLRRPNDRIGLLVFGEYAYVQAPFTLEHETVRTLLDEARIGMAGNRTMIGDAIGMAIRVFDASAARQRTLILLTDGADTGSRVPPAKAAQIAAQRGVRIHTIAVGTASARAGDQPDLLGLKAWAFTTGGQAYSANDRAGLEDVYRKLDALESHDHDFISVRPRRPIFHWPLGCALALLIGHQLTIALLAAWRYQNARINEDNRHA